MTVTEPKESSTLPVNIQQCVQALDDKKAENIRVIHVGDISSVTDYFVIATGTSNPHLRALGESVVQTLKETKEEAIASGLGDQSGWAVVDAYDFMVHLFSAEMREYFNLEGLWKDGSLIEC